MSTFELEVSEVERKQNERQLKQIAGKAQHIEINERSLEAYRKSFADKGLAITSAEDYPQEDFQLVRYQKRFDALVDPSKGIRKVIGSMVRQPITIFNSKGVAEVKDALYYSGYYYGLDKKDNELGAEFHEGSFKRPKLAFTYLDPSNPFDSRTGERRGEYKVSGFKYEHYIFLSADKKERRKQLEEIITKATGTHKGNLEKGHLSFRQPSPDNNHSGTHGGQFNWDLFCDLSLDQAAELQTKNYYTDTSGTLKDKDNRTMKWQHDRLEAVK